MVFEVEGINLVGDLGVVVLVFFQYCNVFKGFEIFMMKVCGVYEVIMGLGVVLQDYVNDNYMEYGVESSLNFFQFMFFFLLLNFKKKIRVILEVGLKFIL